MPARNTVETTGVDLNTDATTTVFSPSHNRQTVERVEVPNSGGTAEFDVEATDGTDTVVLASSGAGGAVSLTGAIPLEAGWTLQIDVTAVEGAAETTTAFVFAEGD